MSQIFLLDTNTVSYILKGRSPVARTTLASLRLGQVACLSCITEGELRYGLVKSGNAPRLLHALDLFLGRIQVRSWGSAEAEAYGTLRAKQEAAGKTLESMDMLIAAHAISLGATLVTSDKAFRGLKGMPAIENWATDL